MLLGEFFMKKAFFCMITLRAQDTDSLPHGSLYDDSNIILSDYPFSIPSMTQYHDISRLYVPTTLLQQRSHNAIDLPRIVYTYTPIIAHIVMILLIQTVIILKITKFVSKNYFK